MKKVLIYGLRSARDIFEAAEGALAVQRKGETRIDVLWKLPRKSDWDATLLSRYIANTRPSIPRHILMAPVHRRDRPWGVRVWRDAGREFTGVDRDILFSITQTLTDIVNTMDTSRSRAVRRRIEQKIVDRRDPRDLLYDLLHGLKSLTRYDHSASILITRDGSEPMELVAEQIAWTKGRSRQIGRRVELPPETLGRLRSSGTSLFQFEDGHWTGSNGNIDLINMIDNKATPNVPREVTAICAPVDTPVGAVGILKLSARSRGILSDFEVDLVDEFLPMASLALQFLARTENMQQMVVQAERKHALANLTRGITHDMNNALGAVLPLVQQLQDDSQTGRIEEETLREDLDIIERSLQTLRRIFESMLSIARGSRRGVGHGNLRRALDSSLTVLEDSLKRLNVDVNLDLPAELPSIRGSQGDLTQLFLNLLTNARDAMRKGGTLTVRARIIEDKVRVAVEDTGEGIPKKHMERLSEPFFTTKDDGNGLGLSICRSVLWEINGTMKFESQPGIGTKVKLELPVLSESEPGSSP